MPPRLLLLETSGRVGQVALADGDALRGMRRLDEGRRHARDLAPAVADLLAAAGWTPRDVEAVVVSRGPGSYTGLRVGLMSAKTFAYATGCTLLAVDTFAVIAAGAPPDAVRLEVIADAQQGKLYRQAFTRAAPGEPQAAASPLEIVTGDAWLASRQAGVVVSGPGLRLVAGRLPAGVTAVEAARAEPALFCLLGLGLARFRAGERDDLWAVEPLYLRASSAEEKWGAPGLRPG